MKWWYPVLVFVIGFIVLGIMGLLEWIKRGKKWTGYFGHYLGCIGRAWAGIWKALRGINPHRSVVATPSDAKFATITRLQFETIYGIVRSRMKRENIIMDTTDKVDGQYGFYLHRCFDCGNFATTMKAYFDMAYREKYGVAHLGIPTMLYPYDMDKGGGHVLFGCDVEGELELYSPYPHQVLPIQLSEKELRSYKPISKG